MENLLAELKNRLFESIEMLNAAALEGAELDREIKKALAINEIAKKVTRRPCGASGGELYSFPYH